MKSILPILALSTAMLASANAFVITHPDGTGRVTGSGPTEIVRLPQGEVLALLKQPGWRDETLVANEADINSDIWFGGGGDYLRLAYAVAIEGNVRTGRGADTLIMMENSVIIGDVRMGDGGDKLYMSANATIIGNVRLGSGSDTLNMSDTAGVSGTVDLGSGKDSIILAGEAIIGHNLEATAPSTIEIADTARVVGDIIPLSFRMGEKWSAKSLMVSRDRNGTADTLKLNMHRPIARGGSHTITPELGIEWTQGRERGNGASRHTETIALRAGATYSTTTETGGSLRLFSGITAARTEQQMTLALGGLRVHLAPVHKNYGLYLGGRYSR